MIKAIKKIWGFNFRIIFHFLEKISYSPSNVQNKSFLNPKRSYFQKRLLLEKKKL